MKFTARERVGLRAMVELARRYGEGPTALCEVAEAQSLPLPYLERIAASLRREGLLCSVRGAHGGYELTRPPVTISVGDVLRAVEGSLVSIDCLRSDEAVCDRQEACETRLVWEALYDRLSETLDRTSLADILTREGHCP